MTVGACEDGVPTFLTCTCARKFADEQIKSLSKEYERGLQAAGGATGR